LADEFLDQGLACEGLVDALILADLVDELGAGLEGELLRKDERVVAVEEKSGNLFEKGGNQPCVTTIAGYQASDDVISSTEG